jgi:hypothetical protein
MRLGEHPVMSEIRYKMMPISTTEMRRLADLYGDCPPAAYPFCWCPEVAFNPPEVFGDLPWLWPPLPHETAAQILLDEDREAYLVFRE